MKGEIKSSIAEIVYLYATQFQTEFSLIVHNFQNKKKSLI